MSADTLPRKIVDLSVTVARGAADRVGRATHAIAERAAPVLERSKTAGRTVAGQARAAAGRTATTAEQGARETATTAEQGAREVAGQTAAQGAAVADTADREAHRAVDQATDAVSDTPGSGVPYEEWTRIQLYDRAQELEIDGRGSMNKSELIAALRAAS